MRIVPIAAALAACLTLAGCQTSSIPEFAQCTLAGDLSPAEAAPGDAVVATGGEYSVVYDTVVTVGGVPAEVIDVVRDNCALCDACRLAVEDSCDPCGLCVQCETTCDLCVQTVSFAVPDLAEGPTDVVITNGYGASDPIPFTVTAPPGDPGR